MSPVRLPLSLAPCVPAAACARCRCKSCSQHWASATALLLCSWQVQRLPPAGCAAWPSLQTLATACWAPCRSASACGQCMPAEASSWRRVAQQGVPQQRRSRQHTQPLWPHRRCRLGGPCGCASPLPRQPSPRRGACGAACGTPAGWNAPSFVVQALPLPGQDIRSLAMLSWHHIKGNPMPSAQSLAPGAQPHWHTGLWRSQRSTLPAHQAHRHHPAEHKTRCLPDSHAAPAVQAAARSLLAARTAAGFSAGTQGSIAQLRGMLAADLAGLRSEGQAAAGAAGMAGAPAAAPEASSSAEVDLLLQSAERLLQAASATRSPAVQMEVGRSHARWRSCVCWCLFWLLCMLISILGAPAIRVLSLCSGLGRHLSSALD